LISTAKPDNAKETFDIFDRAAAEVGKDPTILEKIAKPKISYSEDYGKAVSSCEFWRSSLIENVFDLDISDPIKLQEKAKQEVSDDKLKQSIQIVTKIDDLIKPIACQIIGDHTEYSSYASTSDMISFPKSLLMRMMEGLNENEVEKLSKHIAKNEFKDLILLLTGEYSLKSYLDTVEAWLRISNFQYSYNVDKENNLVIQHDMGKRWSLYFEKLFSHAFHSLNLAGNRLQWEITDNIVAFTIQE